MAPLEALKRDYRDWIELGEGGIPHGVPGWLAVSALRVVASKDVFRTSGYPDDPQSRLANLPMRRGDRPPVARHPIPHREADGNCSPEMLQRLNEMIDRVVDQQASAAELRTSEYEKHHDALFIQNAAERGDSRTGEIAHVHDPQGSLHVHCSPEDARYVIERGWGELHPLAVRGLGLPKSYLLLYRPRDDEDFAAIETIVQAAVDWAIHD